ncbi:MAG: hypothetical protein P4L56_25950 [Candidatus Sulfopaludibacter sp.]|nr:hypothetical protein [Candidatus Sulfopaludibacter sp.]
MKFRIALALAIASSICGAQDRPDPAAYQQLFRQVVELKSLGGHPAARTMWGGLPLKTPRLQEVIGLTDAEVEILNAAATDCMAKIAVFEKAMGPLVFESRLEIADTGKNSDELAQKLKDLDDQRDKMILAHVQELKSALPSGGFEILDAYVRAPADAKKSLLPDVDPPPGMPKKLF